MGKLLKYAAPLATYLLSCAANAAVLDHGNYIEDTDTGLYWLKLDATQNRSYNDIADKLGYQEEFEGWRFAELPELETLILNYGIPSNATSCAVVTYCGTLDAAYAEPLVSRAMTPNF